MMFTIIMFSQREFMKLARSPLGKWGPRYGSREITLPNNARLYQPDDGRYGNRCGRTHLVGLLVLVFENNIHFL